MAKYINLNEINELTMIRNKDVYTRLSLTSERWKDYVEKNDIKTYVLNKRFYFLISDIEILKDKQIKFHEKYIFSKEICRTYDIARVPNALLNLKETAPVPDYIDLRGIGATPVYYEREKILPLLKSMYIYDTEVSGKNHYETYLRRLSTMKDYFGFKENSVSFRAINDFIKTSLEFYTEKSTRHVELLINQYVKLTTLISRFLLKNNISEVYNISTELLNQLIKSEDKEAYQIHLFHFFDYMYVNRSAYKVSNINYNIQYIHNPIEKRNLRTKTTRRKRNSNDIYSIEEYLAFSKYMQSIEIHISQGLYLSDISKTQNYFSTYFYLLMHISNLWRKSDILHIPTIDISKILDSYNIHSIEWFKNNSYTTAQAAAVISAIRNSTYVMEKTQLVHHIFCPNSQEILFATVYSILFLCHADDTYDGQLLNTNKKYNNVSPKDANKFLSTLEGFHFSSLKMNRTVATYITYLQETTGTTKDVTYAKYMRGHVNVTSTLHYVKISEKDIEKLSELLFERGEFGYITDKLLDIISGNNNNLSFEQKTNCIQDIRASFGDSNKINYLMNFVNNIELRRNEILNELELLSVEEAVSKLHQIYVSALPSKEDIHMQCYLGNNCTYPEKNCIDCTYSIPSLYSLHYICNNLKNKLQLYQDTDNLHLKNKYANSIAHCIYILNEAIDKFGREHVYSCLGMTKDELITKVLKIERYKVNDE